MRALTVLFIIISFLPAEARADKIWKEVAQAVSDVLVAGAADVRYQPAPACIPEREALRRAPRPLGTVLISHVSGPQSTAWLVGEVLKAAGWLVIYDDDRRAAEAEQRRYGGNAQIEAVKYFCSVRTEFRNGREYDQSQRGRHTSSGAGGRERLCTVYLRVATGTGLTYTATGVGSSWSRYERFSWHSCNWGTSSRDYTPNDDDWALLAAMVAASNEIIRQAVAPASYGIPRDQAPTASVQNGQVRYCPACGKSTPQGANFCPSCGSRLGVPPAAPTN
jgi:hypothetical protein